MRNIARIYASFLKTVDDKKQIDLNLCECPPCQAAGKISPPAIQDRYLPQRSSRVGELHPALPPHLLHQIRFHCSRRSRPSPVQGVPMQRLCSAQVVPMWCLGCAQIPSCSPSKGGTLKGRGWLCRHPVPIWGDMNLEHFLIIRLSFEDGTQL